MKHFNFLYIERGGICEQKKRLSFTILLCKCGLDIYLCITGHHAKQQPTKPNIPFLTMTNPEVIQKTPQISGNAANCPTPYPRRNFFLALTGQLLCMN